MRDRFVDTLSHGMKQRVGIARTLMHDPQVLLLDEPANGLDPNARVQMRKLLRKLADGGKTLIVTSHILPELAAVCDSVGIIHQGRLKTSGTLQKVLGEIHRDRLMELKASAHRAGGAGGPVGATRGSRTWTPATQAQGMLRFRFQRRRTRRWRACSQQLMADRREGRHVPRDPAAPGGRLHGHQRDRAGRRGRRRRDAGSPPPPVTSGTRRSGPGPVALKSESEIAHDCQPDHPQGSSQQPADPQGRRHAGAVPRW